MNCTTRRRLYVGCATIFLLSACGDSATKKPLTQVAAKVDGEEISIHQINALLSHAQGLQPVSGMSAEQMRKAVLDKLIDQQIVYAQAVSKKVDRDPKVLMLIDAAKREIVARAYMDSLLAASAPIQAADIHQYYVQNPALFAQRKIYTLEEFAMPASPAVLATLKHMVDEGRDMDAIGKFLTGKGINYAKASGVRTAEKIPLDVLPRLAVVEDGSTEFIESGERYYVFHVVSTQVVPVDEASARPQIEVFLGNQLGQRTVTQEVKRLKANARIEYLGDFAKTATTTGGETVATLKMERSTQ